MGRTFIVVLLILFISMTYEEKEPTLYLHYQDNKHKYDHFLVKWKAWQLLSLVGLFGTMLNSFLLYIFYSERNIMASSVNSMIYMNTVYRLIYSTVSIHWRTYNMVRHQTLFNTWFDRDQVNYDMQRDITNKKLRIALLCW